MTAFLPFSEAKAHLSDLAASVEAEHQRVVVTRNGRPSFVMISIDELASLEESLRIIGDSSLASALARSREDLAASRVHLPPEY